VKIAILDDYQNVALSIADWSAVAKKADITVFTDHIDQTDALIERLLPFDVVCVMRERTPLRRRHHRASAAAEVHCFDGLAQTSPLTLPPPMSAVF